MTPQAAPARGLADDRVLLFDRILAAEDANRADIARQLHAGAAQLLAACRMLLPVLQRDASGNHAEAVAQLRTFTDQVATDLHRATFALSPLDPAHPPATALAHHVAEWATVNGARAATHLPAFGDVSPALQRVVFRVVRAALARVIRHGPETTVSVIVERRAGQLAVIVSADGPGAPDPAMESTDNFNLIRAYATLLAGSFDVESTPGHGTSVYFRVPFVPATGVS